MLKDNLVTAAVALFVFLVFCGITKYNKQAPELIIQSPAPIINETQPEETTPPPVVVDQSLLTHELKSGSIIKLKPEIILINSQTESGGVVNEKLAYIIHIDPSELIVNLKPNTELEVISAEVGGAFPSNHAPNGMLLARREDCIIKAKTKENKIIYILVIAGEKLEITNKNTYLQYSNPWSKRQTLHEPTFGELSPIIEVVKL